MFIICYFSVKVIILESMRELIVIKTNGLSESIITDVAYVG